MVGWLVPAKPVFAAETTDSKNPDSGWKIPEQPPGIPPSMEGVVLSAENGTGAIAWGDLLKLYAPFFVAMLIGMVAKTIVDYLDAWDKTAIWVHLRNGMTSVLVSPIVFLGFLTAGQFGTSKQTFIVLSLLAFQNGFFWQTILRKDQRSRSGAPSDSSVGTAT